MILKGQVWRIFTFLIYPPAGDILYFVIAMWLYYSLGTTLERVWGSFRFNLYFFLGVLGHILAAILIYLIFGEVFLLGTSYLNWSLFFGSLVGLCHSRNPYCLYNLGGDEICESG